MGAALSRSLRERRERVQRQEEGMPPSTIPARRTLEDDDSGQEHEDRGLRRRRLLSVPRVVAVGLCCSKRAIVSAPRRCPITPPARVGLKIFSH